MSYRIVFPVLFASFSVMFAGCLAEQEGAQGEAVASSSQEARSQICPAVYDPVCGKDGNTYSNTCEAGGPQRVAYQGECASPCAAVLCPEGTACEVKGKKATCVSAPFDPCWTIRCASGYHCEVQNVQCIKAPCDPVAACVED